MKFFLLLPFLVCFGSKNNILQGLHNRKKVENCCCRESWWKWWNQMRLRWGGAPWRPVAEPQEHPVSLWMDDGPCHTHVTSDSETSQPSAASPPVRIPAAHRNHSVVCPYICVCVHVWTSALQAASFVNNLCGHKQLDATRLAGSSPAASAERRRSRQPISHQSSMSRTQRWLCAWWVSYVQLQVVFVLSHSQAAWYSSFQRYDTVIAQAQLVTVCRVCMCAQWSERMRSRSNSGVRLDGYARLVQETILCHQVSPGCSSSSSAGAARSLLHTLINISTKKKWPKKNLLL